MTGLTPAAPPISEQMNFIVTRLARLFRRRRPAPLADTKPLPVLYSPGYELKIIPGDTRQLVVAFAGIRNPQTGEVRFEWSRALNAARNGAHLILVKDNNCQWYTRPAGRQAVVDAIQSYLDDNGIESSLALGLSMGGYGALVFSTLLHFDHVLALSSRSAVDEGTRFDARNADMTQAVVDGPHSRVLELLDPDTDYCFVSSLDHREDLAHLALIMRRLPDARAFLTRGDHNLVREMNHRGRGPSFTRWVLDRCSGPTPPGILPPDRSVLRLGEYLSEHDLKINLDDWRQHFSSLSPDLIPHFILNHTFDSAYRQQAYPEAPPCPLHLFVQGQELLTHLFGEHGFETPQSILLTDPRDELMLHGRILDQAVHPDSGPDYRLTLKLAVEPACDPERLPQLQAIVNDSAAPIELTCERSPCRIAIPLPTTDKLFRIRLRLADRLLEDGGQLPGFRLIGFHIDPPV